MWLGPVRSSKKRGRILAAALTELSAPWKRRGGALTLASMQKKENNISSGGGGESGDWHEKKGKLHGENSPSFLPEREDRLGFMAPFVQKNQN